jgi:hypothetical protein
MRIYKYGLKLQAENYIKMPAISEIMDIQLQDGKPVMWVLVDPVSDDITVKIESYFTGEKVDTNDFKNEYIATIQHDGLVYHFFMSYEL